ncbi:MAG: polyphosphate kinase 1 [Clostridiales bacterium]|nr:polyphosphate kinase 1 [Clostridiales bacterium]
MAKSLPYFNRELSWLRFNERVLNEADDKNNPLFERIKFASIFLSNLDEFFMVRVGSLHDMALDASEQEPKKDTKTGMTPEEQLEAIYSAVRKLIQKKDRVSERIFRELAKYDIEHLYCRDLKPKDEQFVSAYFQNEILPMLSPQIIDKRHPFPFLNNLEHYVAVELESKRFQFGVIPVNSMFPRIVRLPGKPYRYCLIEDVISHFAGLVFSNYTVRDCTVFRITRNADITMQEGIFDEDMSYKEAMRELLKTRKKLCPVRLEVLDHISLDLEKYLCKKLDIAHNQVFISKSPLEMKFVFGMEDALKKALPASLFYAPLHPHSPVFFDENQPILPQAEKKDLFLSYPFESMSHFIRLLNEAAVDPTVVSIKITLYRMAKNSKIIDALIKAHEFGKEVFAVVELRARFDEQNNIDWASHLEEAGVTLSYGLDRYKTHSKLCLITRKTDAGVQYITQVGTGNYNEKTAAQYTDMCLITANQEIGNDAAEFFLNISMGDTTPSPKHLLIAPKHFRKPLLAMIDEQTALAKQGKESSIIIKINSLTDKPLIDRLIEASKAGVPIHLIVRGICCLRSGLKDLTDTIEVISIVGRYLEHSRIYSFGVGEQQKLYISSGDWMTRSTKSRVEIAAPIYDPQIKEEINHALDIMLHDNMNARVQQKDGSYKRKKNDEPPLDSQEYFFTAARYQK